MKNMTGPLLHHAIDDRIQCPAWPHSALSLDCIRLVVPPKIHRRPLALNQLVQNLLLVLLQSRRHRLELRLHTSVLTPSHRLSPVQCQVEMRPSIVKLFDLAGRVLVRIQESPHSTVQASSQRSHLAVTSLRTQLLQVRLQCQKLTQRVPAQMILLHKLLHVLRRRSSSSSLVHPSACKQRHNRKHLRARPQLQNGKQVSVVVTQDIPSHTDRAFTLLCSLQGVPARFHRIQEQNLQPRSVVLQQILLHFSLDVPIMRAGIIQPKHSRPSSCTSTSNSKPHPVLDCHVLCLAGSPDVTFLHLVLHQNISLSIHHTHHSVTRCLEGLVMGPVLLSLLGHQTNVRDGAHRSRIERPVRFAEFDGLFEHSSVAPIGN
mmetsp:Transcript_54193/g.144479  ORF Transcript_54193/g.144479 Transcript_54193/m.144479 type:complete len:374 (-) Transcript_54193:1198-2319(-)